MTNMHRIAVVERSKRTRRELRGTTFKPDILNPTEREKLANIGICMDCGSAFTDHHPAKGCVAPVPYGDRWVCPFDMEPPVYDENWHPGFVPRSG